MASQKKSKPTAISSGQPAKALDLVGYQNGSVVSREIMSGKAGTVTLFAFDEGEGLSEHMARFDALVHAIDGDAEITIAGRPSRVSEGELMIMPASRPHSLKALTKFKMILTMIRS